MPEHRGKTMWGHIEKVAVCKREPEREASPETNPTGTLILNSQTPELWDNKLCCWGHLDCGILLWQPEMAQEKKDAGRGRGGYQPIHAGPIKTSGDLIRNSGVGVALQHHLQLQRLGLYTSWVISHWKHAAVTRVCPWKRQSLGATAVTRRPAVSHPSKALRGPSESGFSQHTLCARNFTAVILFDPHSSPVRWYLIHRVGKVSYPKPQSYQWRQNWRGLSFPVTPSGLDVTLP